MNEQHKRNLRLNILAILLQKTMLIQLLLTRKHSNFEDLTLTVRKKKHKFLKGRAKPM
jgi:hypothetical protein